MLSAIGTGVTIAALLGAIFVVVTGLVGGFRRSESLARLSRGGVYFVLACMTIAMVTMEAALLGHDFSVDYVSRVGSRETPAYYTAISLWSSLDGSILFWGWILAAYAALVAFVNRRSYKRLMPFVNATMMIVYVRLYR